MHVALKSAALAAVTFVPVSLGATGLTFRGPFSLPNVPRPVVTVHSGDFNKDGKIDLCTANGTGTITVIFQDPANRQVWTPVPVRVGSSAFFARGGDFDGDGIDDLSVADGGSTLYFVRSKGDGTFEKPMALPQGRGPRWNAHGDWNKDGRLDLASSNLNTSTLTIFVNELTPEGAIKFTLTQNPPSGREHTLETFDYDADGNPDLALGQGLPGIQLHKGVGDGKFLQKGNISSAIVGCVEYISVGDFNADGKGDVAPTCIDDATAYAATSNGNGTFKQVLRHAYATGTESSAIGDFNQDGFDDLALVSAGAGTMRVFLSDGAVGFRSTNRPPDLELGPTGATPVFLIARDLDQDGFLDVVTADSASSSCTIFFGRGGEKLFESSDSITGFGSGKDAVVTDFDKDGQPDVAIVSSTLPKAFVYLKPGGRSPTKADFEIPLASKYGTLAVLDVNADGNLDLAGANITDDKLQVALLDASGKVTAEAAYPAGQTPLEAEPAHLDAGGAVDFVLPCSGTNDIWVFLNRGDGTFADGLAVPTLDKPKRVAMADLDGDARTDIVVLTIRVLAVHYGKGDGTFDPPAAIPEEATRSFTDVAALDMDGDGRIDIVAGETRTLSVLLYRGKGGREFETPASYRFGVSPQNVAPIDVDEDGFLDLTASGSAAQAVAISLNRGSEGFTTPEIYRAGVATVGHDMVDMDLDGVIDMFAFGSASCTIRLGVQEGPPPPPRFRRGDSDGNGFVQINDAVATLNALFRGHTISCEDAADADDDGTVTLTDAVTVHNWLFRDGAPPAAPGPLECGEDTTPDERVECKARCQP
ncbi:MAG: VCBS repeat-containing protein [Planctomycetes bacterium]|nr:VCBS repeat-containing protein [Planctomycetota bacterium]